MKKLMLALLVLGISTVIFSGDLAMAEDGEHWEEKGWGRDKEGRLEELMDELGLTDEQKTRMKEQKKDNKTSYKLIREERQQKKDAIKAELDKDVLDQENINVLIEELADLEKQKMHSRVKKIIEMKKILTPEQYQLMKEKHKDFKRHRKGKGRKGHSSEDLRNEE
jgi:Spy/CpxP family protein refolding chaperone